MIDCRRIDEALSNYVRPQTFPVAIRMCVSEEELPDKVRLPRRDMGITISLCHAISMARYYGWTLAVDKYQSCYVAGISMGFLPVLADVADGSLQESLGLYGMSKEQSAAFVDSLPKFEYGKYKSVLIVPLGRATFEPHLIIVYGNPAQIWILLSAFLNATGQPSTTATLTVGAGCANHITRTMQEARCQFVLVGGGERLIAHSQDHECAFSMPANSVEKTIDGLVSGHRIGVFRYPIPSFLRYDSRHQPGFDRIRSHLLGEDS